MIVINRYWTGGGQMVVDGLQGTLYWSDSAKISWLQRQVIVHSLLYYKLGDSVITDQQFDKLARQLMEAQKDKLTDWLKQNTDYGYMMYDWEWVTGYHIEKRLRPKDYIYCLMIAEHVLYLYKRKDD